MQNPEPIDVIIPTYDNFDQLVECIQSIKLTRLQYPMNIIVVNNGGKLDLGNISVNLINAKENLGWIGGLQEGLKYSTSKYVLFANDDILVPRSSFLWLRQMVRMLDLYPYIGAVGPSSNVVMGMQNMRNLLVGDNYLVKFLIGFCLLVRRTALYDAGGVQDMQYGGDDLDLSIRLRKAGYALLLKKDVFVFHHGFQTGNRLFGGPEKANGWNSLEMTDNVNMELIRKHGFLAWRDLFINPVEDNFLDLDTETKVVKEFLNGEKIIVEIGCGAKKTVDEAIGVDIVPKGEVSLYIDQVSVADVVADAEKELPFQNQSVDCIIARHILEHVVDPVSTLQVWKTKLKTKGKLIISCPDERVMDTIVVNPEHKHSFTPDSLLNIAKFIGFKGVGVAENYNSVSFTLCLEAI